MKILEELIKPSFVVHDIGANVGVYPVPASRLVGSTSHVYSIETNPMRVYLLRCNLGNSGNRDCTTIPVAISDTRGACRFKINYGDSNPGLTDELPPFELKMGQEIQVTSLDLDSLVSSFDVTPTNLINTEIEGAEEFAIRGMLGSLVEHRPVLLIEIHGEQAAPASFELLDTVRYLCFSLDKLQGPACGLDMILSNTLQGVFDLVARSSVRLLAS